MLDAPGGRRKSWTDFNKGVGTMGYLLSKLIVLKEQREED